MGRRTHEQFVKEMQCIHPNLEILGTYIIVTEKILVRCKIHNYIFYVIPDNLLHGKGCKLCGIEFAHEKQKMTLEEFIEDSKVTKF